MSLKTAPRKLIFNTLNADSLNVAGGIMSIAGLEPFAVANVVTAGCFGACPAACTPQEVTITPTVPSATCECPWMWDITIRQLPCSDYLRATHVLPAAARTYNYVDPNESTPTVDAIIASVVAQINGDPYAIVTAVDNADGTFTITEKNCDSGVDRTCGFSAFVTSGDLVVDDAHSGAVLSAEEIHREFPILPGHVLATPTQLAFCGNYCKYRFKIKPVEEVADYHGANVYNHRYLEVEIYVNKLAATFAADWNTPITAALACLTPNPAP